jgi:hypothetical protein
MGQMERWSTFKCLNDSCKDGFKENDRKMERFTWVREMALVFCLWSPAGAI